MFCTLVRAGCSCIDFTNIYNGKTYGNCVGSGSSRICYVNEPTTCSDATDSENTNKKYSTVACDADPVLVLGINIF